MPYTGRSYRSNESPVRCNASALHAIKRLMRISSALQHLRSSCRDVYDTRMSVCPAVWSEPSGAGQPSKNIQQRTGHSAQSKVIKHDHERRDGGDGATNDKTHKGSCTHTQGSRSDFTISFCTRVLVMSCVDIGDVSATSRGDRMIQHPVCSQHRVEQNLVSSPCVSAPPYRARGGVCIVSDPGAYDRSAHRDGHARSTPRHGHVRDSETQRAAIFNVRLENRRPKSNRVRHTIV